MDSFIAMFLGLAAPQNAMALAWLANYGAFLDLISGILPELRQSFEAATGALLLTLGLRLACERK